MFFCKRHKRFDEPNRIFVKDMVVDVAIGAFDNEKGRVQKVRINIIAIPDVWPDERNDNLDETVSYDRLVAIVFRHTRDNKDHIHLVETLAERIAADCLKENPLAKITVRVEKLEIYSFAIPGVEITRIKRH